MLDRSNIRYLLGKYDPIHTWMINNINSIGEIKDRNDKKIILQGIVAACDK